MKKVIEVKDRVVFTKMDSGGDNEKNPLWGGKCGFIVGSVYEADQEGNHPVKVRWDNGATNAYKAVSLEHYTFARAREKFVKEAKARAKPFIKFLKPYRKYVVITILLLVLDHFLLDAKYFKRLKAGVGKAIDKIVE